MITCLSAIITITTGCLFKTRRNGLFVQLGIYILSKKQE